MTVSDAAAPAALEVAGLDVRIGESHILHDVTFAAAPGVVTALLGRNGAGKTTTIRSLLGLAGRRGSVRIGGVETGGLPTHQVVRLGVGYVPEDREVFADLTVAENLQLAERGPAPRYGLVHELFPELAERSRQRAGSLSGGQQQMLAIGRALLNRNRLLLVDEPTKGLSPAMVARAVEALARAALEATVLIVEQNLAVARRVARDAVVLDQGRVVHSGPVAQLVEDEALAERYLGVHAGVAGPEAGV